LPSKMNQARCHRIPKQKHKLMNSLGALLRSRRAHDASLRQRGSLTAWFTDEAIEGWRAEPRTTQGGQPWHWGSGSNGADTAFQRTWPRGLLVRDRCTG